MITVQGAIDKSVTDAKRALSAINTDFAKLPIPPNVNKKASAGSLIALASRGDIFVDPIVAIKGVKAKANAALKSSRRPIEKAQAVADWLAKAADYLRDGSRLPSPPDSVPPHVAANIEALKTFARAGLVSGDEIASKLSLAATDASRRLDSEEKDFKRFFSTATVSSMKQGADYAERCGRPAMAAGMRKTYATRAERHNRLYQKIKAERKAL